MRFQVQSKITIDRIELEKNPKYVTGEAVVENVNNEHIINMDIMVLQGAADVKFQFAMNLNILDQYAMLLQSEPVDPCEPTKSMGDPLVKCIMKGLLQYSNLTENCPFEAGPYVIRGFKIAERDTPPFMMPGNYRVDIMVENFDNKVMEFILKMKVFFNHKMF